MISCRLVGGLGNQLFQIFTTIAYALKTNKPFFFLNNNQLGNGENDVIIRYTYWKTFMSALKPFLRNMEQVPKLSIKMEKGFNYEDLNKNIMDNVLLVGYFQSPKYFDEYKETIIRLIKLESKKIMVKEKLIRYSFDFINDINISLHFRIGDYKKYPDKHPILGEAYYSDSISVIINQLTNKYPKIIYFCEDEDLLEVENIIEILSKKFPLLVFTRAASLLEDWEQLLCMSLCSHNIIANSTFSWWGAYLNNNPEKIVCYPERWFDKKAGINTSDLFPVDWKKVAFN